MNINKRIRPALVDSKITSKLVRTLKKPEVEHWKPVKNLLQTIYSDWIEPHSYFFICLALFIIFLLYRYRTIQNQKIEEEMMKEMGVSSEKSDYDRYTEMVLAAYNQQEKQRIEPMVKILPKHADRIRWHSDDSESESPAKRSKKRKDKLPPAYQYIQQPANMPNSGFAYPMYPYVQGGTLLPAQSR